MKKRLIVMVLAVLFGLSGLSSPVKAATITLTTVYSEGVVSYAGTGLTENTLYVLSISNGEAIAGLGQAMANDSGAIAGDIVTGQLDSGYQVYVNDYSGQLVTTAIIDVTQAPVDPDEGSDTGSEEGSNPDEDGDTGSEEGSNPDEDGDNGSEEGSDSDEDGDTGSEEGSDPDEDGNTGSEDEDSSKDTDTNAGGNTPGSQNKSGSGSSYQWGNTGGQTPTSNPRGYQVPAAIQGKNAIGHVGSRGLSQAIADTSEEGNVVFRMQTTSRVNHIQLTMDRGIFKDIQEAKVHGLTIESDFGQVTFDQKTIETLVGDSEEAVTFGMTVLEKDSLDVSETVKKQIGDRPVYDFSLRVGEQTISDFKGGKVEVSVPYTLAEGENPAAVVVYYMNNSGQLEVVDGVYNPDTKQVTMVLTHFSTYVIGYDALSYVDVAIDAWYTEAVQFVTSRGAFEGIGHSRFGPDLSMTRAMFVQVLANISGTNLETVRETPYVDVRPGAWYEEALAWATEVGIVEGNTEGCFLPDSPVSREQMALMLDRYMVYASESYAVTESETFVDQAFVSSWATSSVTRLHAYGLIQGVGDNRFEPSQLASRSEVASLIRNYMYMRVSGF